MFKQTYHDLAVFQASDEFIQMVYRETKLFPSDEKYGITSQIRRAAASIALNIVEGQARSTTKDFLRFLYQSRGSVAECGYLVELSMKLGYLSPEKYSIIEKQRQKVSYLLQNMITALKRKIGK